MILKKLNIFIKSYHFILKNNQTILNYKIKQNIFNQRCLHLNLITNSKLYVDRENQHAHNVFTNNENYHAFKDLNISHIPIVDNINELTTNNNDKNANQIFDEFQIIARYCKDNNVCISNDQFDDFIDAFTGICHTFSDEQLIESLKYMTILPSTPIIYYKNFMELWLALDDATSKRLQNWEPNQILYVCDCWYSLHLTSRIHFVWLAIRRIGRKIKRLDKNQMVHSLFFCNLLRKPIIDMIDYEKIWKNHLKEMTIHEIGVMSMGFFKTETPIHHQDLIEMICKRLLDEMNTISDITLANILKILRYSSRVSHSNMMYNLMDKMCPYVNKVSLLTCLHIALLGIDMQHCHDKCIQLIIERFLREINESRLKDLERIAHVMSLYNISNDNGIKDKLCMKILDELPKRINEIVLHPKCLTNCLHYLTLCGHHNDELLNTIFDLKFLKHAYGSNLSLGREIFCLDSYTRINLAGKYIGNQASDKNRETMGRLLTNYIPEKNSKFKLNATDKILVEVNETCKTIFKKSAIKHVLPHFQRPDIVLCYDKVEKKFIKFDQSSDDDYRGVILTKENMFKGNNQLENIITIIMVIKGWNHYVRSTDRLTGVAEMKLKQLEILNHNYIAIPWHEWRALENENDRQKYLKRKLLPIIEF